MIVTFFIGVITGLAIALIAWLFWEVKHAPMDTELWPPDGDTEQHDNWSAKR